MGLDIWVMNGRDYYKDRANCVFHATYHATTMFNRQSHAFRELTSFANDDQKSYPCEVTYQEYSHLIPKFEREKTKLEKAGKTQRGRYIDDNTITLYDCIDGCVVGLKRAKHLRKKIRIS